MLTFLFSNVQDGCTPPWLFYYVKKQHLLVLLFIWISPWAFGIYTLLREVTMHFLKRKISLNKVSIAWPDIENNIEDKNKTDTDKKKKQQPDLYWVHCLGNKSDTKFLRLWHQWSFLPILSVFPFKVITKD